MRDRASIILFIALLLILIILWQNGSLNNLLSSFSVTNYAGNNGQPLLPTVRPLFFSTATPNGQILPPPALPSNVYVPPTYIPAYAPDGSTQVPPVYNPNNNVGGNTGSSNVPSGILSSNGQCIVPNGWTPYTVQGGETLAVIASAYNLTVEQLAAANCLSNPDLIYEGQVIAVPGAR